MADSDSFTFLSLLFAFFLVTFLPKSEATKKEDQTPYIGINIRTTNTSNLPSPSSLISLLLRQNITHIRFFEANQEYLAALANTNISVTLGIGNHYVPIFAANYSAGAEWIRENVVSFIPKISISAVAVGDEVLTTTSISSSVLLTAVQNLYTGLLARNLHTQIKISTPNSFSIITNPFPPSQAKFNRTLKPLLFPLIKFLSRIQSPVMMNLYPHKLLTEKKSGVTSRNCLFQSITPLEELADPNTLLRYNNIYDAMIDATYFSIIDLVNITNISILVSETGWPAKGNPYEPYATVNNAGTYISNLIKHVLDGTGTPFKPETTSNVFLYELFNEDLKEGLESERNYGLFYGNSTPVYLLHVEELESGFMAKDRTNLTFCVAADGSERKDLQAALDWACGPGMTNCTEIQSGEDCYEPNTLMGHASYAFDNYYQKQRKAASSCDFNGVAIVTTIDPSHGHCIFPGSNRTSEKQKRRQARNVTNTSMAAMKDEPPYFPYMFTLLWFSVHSCITYIISS